MLKEPWFTPDAVILLDKLLREHFVCFEWGSGGSTHWFATRVRHLTSIEHDSNWHRKCTDYLVAHSIVNVDYRHVRLKTGNYTSVIREFPNDHFDVISVDGVGGIHRRVAIIEAVPKLKTNGILIVDDSNYIKCSHVVDFLRYWPQVDTYDNRRSTTFMFKPEDATNESFREPLHKIMPLEER